MRDTFLLLWVGFLVVGVIGSIVSSIRKQAQQSQTPQSPRRVRVQRTLLTPATSPRTGSAEGGGAQWQPPPGQLPEWVQRIAAQVASPQPAPARRPAPPPAQPARAAPSPMVEHSLDFPGSRRRSRPVFGNRKAIVQAVIAAEVLGKPRGLRDEYS